MTKSTIRNKANTSSSGCQAGPWKTAIQFMAIASPYPSRVRETDSPNPYREPPFHPVVLTWDARTVKLFHHENRRNL